MNETVIEITNTDYFYMIDNQIRPVMMSYESNNLLPLAKKLLEKSNIKADELKNFPIEGYYYETEQLREYFKIIRNIHHNTDIIPKIIQCEELEILKHKCDNDLFGILDPGGRGGEGPIKRRYDILTLTMENMSANSYRPWTITNIMQNISKLYDKRVNLVELAYLTGNPKCLCCGAESNALNRMIACVSGSMSGGIYYENIQYAWKVSPEVELLGDKLVHAYNVYFEKILLESPTIKNHNFFKKTPKVPRVALLGYVLLTNEYYHWILDWNGNLTDIYSTNIITTENYEKCGYIQTTYFNGNIFNATPK